MKIEESIVVSSDFITALIDEYAERNNEKFSYKALLTSVLIALFCGFCFKSMIAACLVFVGVFMFQTIFIGRNAERKFVSYLVESNISPHILHHSYVLREFADNDCLGEKIILSMSKKHTGNLRILYNQLFEKNIIQLSPPTTVRAPFEIHVKNKLSNKIYVNEHGMTLNDKQYISWDEVFDVYVDKRSEDDNQAFYYLTIILNSSYMSQRDAYTFLLDEFVENIVPIELWMRAQVPKYKVTLVANGNT
jgi:hypothetical protein